MEMTIFAILGIVLGVIIGIMAMMSQKRLLQKEVTTLSAQVESVKQEARGSRPLGGRYHDEGTGIYAERYSQETSRVNGMC